MKNFSSLKKKYAKILASFDKQKNRVYSVIDRWHEKGKVALYQKYYDMVTEANELKKQIDHEFLNEHGNASVVYNKIRRLQKIYNILQQETKPILRQWFEAIVVALALALVIRNLAFTLYHVPTGSAEPNILVGDRIWGNKAAYFFSEVKRGDLVIFDDPREGYDESSKIQYFWQRYVGFPIPLLGLKGGPINVVKRVIGLPGDVVEGKVENGKTVIYLNGKILDEPYVNTHPLIVLFRDKGFLPFKSFGPLRVPEFLRKERKLVRYTYDASKPYAEQPYYFMHEKDIYHHPVTGDPILYDAYSPTPADQYGLVVDEFGPLTVPAGMYWMMGDSRKNSEDSRYWQCLDQKYIHGRASFIAYSVDSEEALWLFDLIKHPIDFWKKHIRWGRFFKKLT